MLHAFGFLFQLRKDVIRGNGGAGGQHGFQSQENEICQAGKDAPGGRQEKEQTLSMNSNNATCGSGNP